MTTRLLHIVDSASGDVSGQLGLLAAGLTRRDYELHVCLLRNDRGAAALRDAGAAVHIIPRRLSWDPWALVQLQRFIARLKPHVVQTWLWDANTYGRMAARRAGVKTVIAVERFLDDWKRWPQWQLDRRLAHHTASIVAAAPQVQEFYQQHQVHPRSYTVIPDGVAIHTANATARAELLDELELPADAILVGVSGPLRRDYRIKNLVWAMDILKWVYNKAHLLILGDGPQRAALMRYVDCVDINERVHFLGVREDAASVLANVDFFWHAAARDGAASALLQVMAAGVPVVAIDTPVHRALVTHGENGFLVEPNDRPAFARWTHCMLEDAPLRQRVAQAGVRRVAGFTPQQLVENYQQLYRQVLN